MRGTSVCFVLKGSVCVCLCLCVCVGKQVWTSQRCCWRFSARPLGERAEGCKGDL